MNLDNVTSSLSILRTSGHFTGHLSLLLKEIGHLFYLHDPEDTSYSSVDQVPNFFRNAWPYFLLFILVENLVLWVEKKPTYRLNDGITSLSHGVIQECGRLVFRGAESALYIYLYERFRLVDLPWSSPVTWYLTLICVDFCYYWVHRASHEVHLFWAQHQVHHSSEEFNLAVGLRQSLLQGWCSFMFYLPMSLFVPPAHFLTHQQFNLMYQFWIHTQTVTSLGPLEYIFNTPQHHRVHHGCNLYCIDKNYGGLFIIWDRIFGTFAAERRKEDIVYGLVFNQPSFNPFFLQVFYNQYVVDKWRSQKGLRNKLSAVIKGPSWSPGSPWTGIHEEKIDIRSREKYDVKIPTWCNLYLASHFVLTVLGFQQLAGVYMSMSPLAVLVFSTYIIISLTTIGMLFDNRRYAAIFESVRCLLLVAFCRHGSIFSASFHISGMVEAYFVVSALIWLLRCLDIVQLKKSLV